VLYTYLGYPALLAVLARIRRPAVRTIAGPWPSVSIVVAVHNEAAAIRARITDCLRLAYPGSLEVVVVSDGSTDATDRLLAEEAARHPGRVRWGVFQGRVGKSEALNRGVAMASGEIIVFTDARQRFDPAAVLQLVANFEDPSVGAVSGELLLEEPAQARHAGGLYWRLEKWIRKAESRLDSVVGATGAIYAIRRSLYIPLPPGTILDDVLTPMRIALRGYRVLFEERAVATDVATERMDQEFHRKVRTLAGNYQLMWLLPALLLPWRNRLWWQYVSHKVCRLAAPFCLIALMIASTVLSTVSALYAALFLAQLIAYGLAFAGWLLDGRRASRFTTVPLTFVMLNAAAVVALVQFLRLRSGMPTHAVWAKPSHG
jgi:cellulose synthase/poly-beta-1,6-N-acetylglucosamine synthase-like glycosyltransferase